jgi:hypothetical protein
MMMRGEEDGLKEIEALHKIIPFDPCAASYRMGWEGLQAVRWRKLPASGEVSLPPVSPHGLVLTIRPPEKSDVRYEGVKRDMPPRAGSIAVVPAGSPVLSALAGEQRPPPHLPRSESHRAGRGRVVRIRSNPDGGATARWFERA